MTNTFSPRRILSFILMLSIVFTLLGGAVPALAAPADSTVVTYPLQSCDEVSEQLTVTVNGENVPIVKFMSNYDYCHFSFDGTAEITITSNSAIGTYSISPLALEIPSQVNGNSLTFTLSQSRYLIVKIGSLRDLVIAADDLETDAPEASGSGIFNITDPAYGADPTGAALATEAIQKAIDDASAYGTADQPGIVYVPAGLFTFTSITFKSNVSMYLEGGAVLKASTDISQYGQAMFHKDSVGLDGYWNITTEPGSENVKLYGRGTVDGSGMELRYEQRRLNHVIIPVQCSGFTMDGIVVRDGALWTVVPVRCDDVTIINTKHLNDVATNTEDDAIDIVECQDVLVQHTIAISEDDTYSTKTWEVATDIATYWAGDPEPLDNVTFDDCFAFTRCGGFKVGWGCFQPQSNITFKNSYVYRCMFAVNITMNYGTVPIRNITFENIDVEGFWPKDANKGRWLEFWISGGCSGKAENVLVKDINIRTNNHIPSTFTGRNQTSCFDGVTLQNITMPGAAEPASTLKEMSITNTNGNIRNLKILTGEDPGETADYTRIHLAMNEIPDDLSGYTSRSVQALNDAIAAIDYTLTDQTAVDAMADGLEDAIENLKFKGFTEYEAENAAVTGGAINDSTGASGGKYVGNLGNGAASVTFTVNAAEAGKRTMYIYYAAFSARDFQVTVNGGSPVTVNCPGSNTDWDTTILTAQTTVDLNAGENTIVIGNTAAYAPNLDKISVGLTDNELAQVEAVEELILAIGDISGIAPGDAAAIHAAQEKIDEARQAYDRLAPSLQDLVGEYDTLTAAEAAIEALTQTVSSPGDVDGNGTADAADMITLKNLILNGAWSPEQLAQGDLNGNGMLDVADIIMLKMLILTR